VVCLPVFLKAELLFAAILLQVGAEVIELHLTKLVFKAALSVRIVAAALVVVFAQVFDVRRIDEEGPSTAALLLAAGAALAAAASLAATAALLADVA
jgi:hypothetical protein